MSNLAKDVATELDRRHRRRRLGFLSLCAAAIAAAALYLRCGDGWGIGGRAPKKQLARVQAAARRR